MAVRPRAEVDGEPDSDLDNLSARSRLIEAALRLFSTVGYEATSVGDVEEAAGFTRRGGNMYRYFSSKDDLLIASLTYDAAETERALRAMPIMALPDLRSELLLAATCTLRALDAQKRTVSILEKTGPSLPKTSDFSPRSIVADPFKASHDFLAERVGSDSGWDLEALTVLLYGGLGGVRRNEWTFGTPGLDVSDDRLVATWARLAELALKSGT